MKSSKWSREIQNPDQFFTAALIEGSFHTSTWNHIFLARCLQHWRPPRSPPPPSRLAAFLSRTSRCRPLYVLSDCDPGVTEQQRGDKLFSTCHSAGCLLQSFFFFLHLHFYVFIFIFPPHRRRQHLAGRPSTGTLASIAVFYFSLTLSLPLSHLLYILVPRACLVSLRRILCFLFGSDSQGFQ